MSHWMTSGARRLRKRQNHSGTFASRAQECAKAAVSLSASGRRHQKKSCNVSTLGVSPCAVSSAVGVVEGKEHGDGTDAEENSARGTRKRSNRRGPGRVRVRVREGKRVCASKSISRDAVRGNVGQHKRHMPLSLPLSKEELGGIINNNDGCHTTTTSAQGPGVAAPWGAVPEPEALHLPSAALSQSRIGLTGEFLNRHVALRNSCGGVSANYKAVTETPVAFEAAATLTRRSYHGDGFSDPLVKGDETFSMTWTDTTTPAAPSTLPENIREKPLSGGISSVSDGRWDGLSRRCSGTGVTVTSSSPPPPTFFPQEDDGGCNGQTLLSSQLVGNKRLLAAFSPEWGNTSTMPISMHGETTVEPPLSFQGGGVLRDSLTPHSLMHTPCSASTMTPAAAAPMTTATSACRKRLLASSSLLILPRLAEGDKEGNRGGSGGVIIPRKKKNKETGNTDQSSNHREFTEVSKEDEDTLKHVGLRATSPTIGESTSSEKEEIGRFESSPAAREEGMGSVGINRFRRNEEKNPTTPGAVSVLSPQSPIVAEKQTVRFFNNGVEVDEHGTPLVSSSSKMSRLQTKSALQLRSPLGIKSRIESASTSREWREYTHGGKGQCPIQKDDNEALAPSISSFPPSACPLPDPYQPKLQTKPLIASLQPMSSMQSDRNTNRGVSSEKKRKKTTNSTSAYTAEEEASVEVCTHLARGLERVLDRLYELVGKEAAEEGGKKGDEENEVYAEKNRAKTCIRAVEVLRKGLLMEGGISDAGSDNQDCSQSEEDNDKFDAADAAATRNVKANRSPGKQLDSTEEGDKGDQGDGHTSEGNATVAVKASALEGLGSMKDLPVDGTHRKSERSGKAWKLLGLRVEDPGATVTNVSLTSSTATGQSRAGDIPPLSADKSQSRSGIACKGACKAIEDKDSTNGPPVFDNVSAIVGGGEGSGNDFFFHRRSSGRQNEGECLPIVDEKEGKNGPNCRVEAVEANDGGENECEWARPLRKRKKNNGAATVTMKMDINTAATKTKKKRQRQQSSKSKPKSSRKSKSEKKKKKRTTRLPSPCNRIVLPSSPTLSAVPAGPHADLLGEIFGKSESVV